MPIRWKTLLTLLLGVVLTTFATAIAVEENASLTVDGFIRDWLILAPIALDANQSGADGLAKEWIKDEDKLQPKEGDKVKVATTELTWKKIKTPEHLVDLNGFLGKPTEDSVAYAVTYLVAEKEIKGAKLKTGSDDQFRVILNGKKVFESLEARAADKDQDTTEVTLKKGVNVVLAKVVNEKADWAFCVRFLDKDDKPIKNLKVRLTGPTSK